MFKHWRKWDWMYVIKASVVMGIFVTFELWFVWKIMASL